MTQNQRWTPGNERTRNTSQETKTIQTTERTDNTTDRQQTHRERDNARHTRQRNKGTRNIRPESHETRQDKTRRDRTSAHLHRHLHLHLHVHKHFHKQIQTQDFKPLQVRPTERKMSITRSGRQQRMCNVWYMIRKGDGRQPDNICYPISPQK